MGGSTPEFDRIACELGEIVDQRKLFSIPAGDVYLGQLDGRPCVFVIDGLMLSWVNESERTAEIPAGRAVAYCFESEDARDALIREEGWERLADGYLREEMWELFKTSTQGEASRGAFEIAYVDAIEAIRGLPCEDCGTVAWPTITKPERESAEWWDDPSPSFSCRKCGRHLGDPFVPAAIREPTDSYPHEGVVDRSRSTESP